MKKIFPVMSIIIALGFVPAFAFAGDSGQVAAKAQSYAVAAATETQSGGVAAKSADTTAGKSAKISKREKIAARHEKMKQELNEMEKRLDEKVAAMNSATGDAKIAAMSAVINELAAQRKESIEAFKSFHAHERKYHRRPSRHMMQEKDMMHQGEGHEMMEKSSGVDSRNMNVKTAAFEARTLH